MFVEVSIPNRPRYSRIHGRMPDDLPRIDVLNLNLISTTNGGLRDVQYNRLEPNNISITIVAKFCETNISKVLDDLFNPDIRFEEDPYYMNAPLGLPIPHFGIECFTYKGQKFFSILSAIMYMNDVKQIFLYYNLDYLLKKHTRKEIDDSNERLIHNLNLSPFPRR